MKHNTTSSVIFPVMVTKKMTVTIMLRLSMMLSILLCCGYAQDSFRFPSPVADSDSFSNYASHDTPTWHDFADFVNHPVYGGIGASVGRLNLSYEGQDSFELHDGGNCTATIISERLLITNAHCVYSPRYSPSAGEDILLKNLSLAMDAHAANDTGDVYPVKIKPIEINETLDFAILEFAAASPYEKYGAVDLRNHRSAQVGESLFMIHHSNITGHFDGNNYKRITESNCTRLNESQFEGSDIPILMPDEESKRPVNPAQDIPHFCDSEQGSSGSLIYARDDSAVVGLHFSGRNAREEADRFNLYIDIEVICSQSRVLQRFCTQQQGAFAITSSPSGATVSIDGRVIGTTPLNESAYDAGVYRLSLDYNGYETYSESIRITAGQTLQRNITLEAREPEVIRTVEQLERRAKEGGTLKLAAVTFHLDAPLELSGDVVLLGEGYEETRIVSSAPEYVVRYTGGGTFVAQGIGFEHVGEENAYVVKVENGVVDIDACEFTGGSRLEDAPPRSGGSGLWLAGDTTGKVANSLFHTNVLNGLQMTDNAEPRLEKNRLYDNAYAGIVYTGLAGGSAVENKSYDNGYHGITVESKAKPILIKNEVYQNVYYGIRVADESQPNLEQNQSYNNFWSGIAYINSAAGNATGNEIYSNHHHGIAIKGEARPRLQSNESYDNMHDGIQVSDSAEPYLEQNQLHDNKLSGIAYLNVTRGSFIDNESYGNGSTGIFIADDAEPTITSNHIYQNEFHGIRVGENAQPTLEQNRLHDNMQVGILYSDLAAGRAVGNESYQNGMHGISLQDNANPILEQNNLHDNNESGIIYLDSSGGNAIRNRSHRNVGGITIMEDAQPIIHYNDLYGNMLSGILYFGSAGGNATGNESYSNGSSGISIEGNATPTIKSNETYQNEYHGIHVSENAQPILEQNRLYDNTYAGILYRDLASGSAFNNESYNNRWGIYIYETANPTLSNNTAYNNPDGNIVDKR